MNDSSNSRFYELEDIRTASKENPRTFKSPTPEEIKYLKPGDEVNLVFAVKNPVPVDCSSEKLWVRIKTIDRDSFTGCLTNQPRYIQNLDLGDKIEFKAHHIASILLKKTDPNWINKEQKAVISTRIFEEKFINRLYRERPVDNEDSGWRMFSGDENREYISDPRNSAVVSLDMVLDIEPLIEDVLKAPVGTEFEWSELFLKFVKVEEEDADTETTRKWWEFWK